MKKENKIFYWIIGLIISICIFGILFVFVKGANKSDSLKELSYYYHSIGEEKLSEKYFKAYSFFQNIFLFMLIPLISSIILISNTIIKNK